MATPVFKFQHPDLPGEDLYFIQNTFFELPQTVPMDLASFIWYHKKINRTLDGFIFGWRNLCEFQTTLNGFDFKSRFNEEEKLQLCLDALFANALEVATYNKDYSNQLKVRLDQNASEKDLFLLITSFEDLKVNKDVDSYLSRHQLMDYLWENHNDKFDELKSYQKDKEIISELLDISGLGLSFADNELKRDLDFLLSALQKDHRCWVFIPKDIQNNLEFTLSAISQNYKVLHYANEKIKGDKSKIIEIVACEGNALEHISKELKADKEVVLAAVTTSGHSLEYACEELKADKEVAIKAVNQSGYALKFANDVLKADKEVVLAAVSKSGSALEYASEELKADKEVVLATVTTFGYALEFASEELKDDKEVVLAAVSSDGWAINFASEELKKDEEVIQVAEKDDFPF